eukprot:6181820-Pyramimonas_sp.AAC.1
MPTLQRMRAVLKQEIHFENSPSSMLETVANLYNDCARRLGEGSSLKTSLPPSAKCLLRLSFRILMRDEVSGGTAGPAYADVWGRDK